MHFSCTIRSLLGKVGELTHLLVSLDVHVVCVQESWLDASVENPVLPNYVVVSRRDRCPGPNRGGVITYARQDLNNIVQFSQAKSSERLWHIVQRDSGNVAICNWYFSPSGDLSEIDSLKSEFEEISRHADT